MVLTRAQEQRLSRLEVAVVDIQRTLDQRFAELRDLLGLRIDCDEEQLPVMDDETDLLGPRTIVDPKVEIHKSLVHKAILEEKPASQFQVPVSDLEHGLRFHNASSIVCEDSQYVVGCDEWCDHQKSILQVSHVKERNVLVTESASVTINQVAHQLFDKMSFRVESKRRQIKCHKSWRFKFKQRVATRESKSGFEVNMKHNQSKEYPCLFLAGNVATLGHILFESEMKFNGCRMLLQLLRNVIHKKRQRKTPKYHKSWKFRFKNMDLQRIMTQLDTQHFIFRWDSEGILHLSTVVHHLETSHKQFSLAIDALTDFGVDVIIFHGEQQLGCKVVMLRFMNKGRFRLFQSFSRLVLLALINLWLSKAYAFSGQLQDLRKVSELERKKKLCYKTWMFKYKVDEEGQGILQSRTGGVQEVSAVICFLRRRHLHLHLDCEEPELVGQKRNHGVFIQLHGKQKQRKYSKCWKFKFRKKKIDHWLGYNLIVAYLGNKKTWTKLRVREHDNLTWKEDASDESWSRSRMKLGEAMITCKNLLEKSYDTNVEIVAWSKSPGRSEISCEVDAFGDQESSKFQKFDVAFLDISTVAKTQDLGFVHVLHKEAVLDSKLGCTILRGDVIICPLADHLKPGYVVFLTKEASGKFEQFSGLCKELTDIDVSLASFYVRLRQTSFVVQQVRRNKKIRPSKRWWFKYKYHCYSFCQESFAYQITSFSTNLEVKVSLKGEDLLQIIWVAVGLRFGLSVCRWASLKILKLRRIKGRRRSDFGVNRKLSIVSSWFFWVFQFIVLSSSLVRISSSSL